MSPPTAFLAPDLSAALAPVHVDPDGRTAVVHGALVEADGPRLLRAALAVALYERLHTGRTADGTPDEPGERRRSLRDPDLERALGAVVPRADVAVAGRVVAAVPGGAVVALPDARVRVPAKALLGPLPEVGGVVEVAVPAARAGLSPGFFLTQSGGRSPRPPARPDGSARVYVHVPCPEDAAAVWGAVLGVLDDHGGAYRSKVASSARVYPRRDAIVVYSPQARTVAALLADRLAGHPGVGPTTSAFAQRIGHGVAVACEPADDRPGRRGLSFGEHRSVVVADALVSHAAGGGPLDRERAVAEALLAAGVDPRCPARNLPLP